LAFIDAKIVVFPMCIDEFCDMYAGKFIALHAGPRAKTIFVDIAKIFSVTVATKVYARIVEGAAAAATTDTHRLPLALFCLEIIGKLFKHRAA